MGWVGQRHMYYLFMFGGNRFFTFCIMGADLVVVGWVRNWVEISGLTCTILDRYLYWWVVGLEGYIRRFLM